MIYEFEIPEEDKDGKGMNNEKWDFRHRKGYKWYKADISCHSGKFHVSLSHAGSGIDMVGYWEVSCAVNNSNSALIALSAMIFKNYIKKTDIFFSGLAIKLTW